MTDDQLLELLQSDPQQGLEAVVKRYSAYIVLPLAISESVSVPNFPESRLYRVSCLNEYRRLISQSRNIAQWFTSSEVNARIHLPTRVFVLAQTICNLCVRTLYLLV